MIAMIPQRRYSFIFPIVSFNLLRHFIVPFQTSQLTLKTHTKYIIRKLCSGCFAMRPLVTIKKTETLK